MKKLILFGLAACLIDPVMRAEDALDRLDDALTWSAAQGDIRARVSGTMDLEGYEFSQPAPGLIDSQSNTLFNPRTSLFVDAQLGPSIYFFTQARIDRGFDPSNDGLRGRFDEYALRWAADPHGRFNLQIGKFATVVGNWTARHGSWTDPFVTAPLPYENLTGVWDTEPPHSVSQLLVWSHIHPGLPPSIIQNEKYLRVPLIWGPSYTAGAAISGEIGQIGYAVELKNAALSSRPDVWDPDETQWQHPTVSGRLSWSPDESWQIGWSASSGPFLRALADPLISPPQSRNDYRERLLGQDISYAWHHFQFWAEIYYAQFQLPPVASVSTVAYYLEAKYKFTPQFSAALRWNRQTYGTVNDHGTPTRWGRDIWRIDAAPTYRFTPHLQLKVQYSLQRGDTNDNRLVHLIAAQATVRF